MSQVGMSTLYTEHRLADLVHDSQGAGTAFARCQFDRDGDVSSHRQNLPW